MSQHSVLITHIWYDGPKVAVQVLQNGEWVPYSNSEISEELYNCVMAFDEDDQADVFPPGRYLFFTESGKLTFVGGAVVEE